LKTVLLVTVLYSAWFQVSAAVYIRSSVFCDVTRRSLVVTDVLGQPTGELLNPWRCYE